MVVGNDNRHAMRLYRGYFSNGIHSVVDCDEQPDVWMLLEEALHRRRGESVSFSVAPGDEPARLSAERVESPRHYRRCANPVRIVVAVDHNLTLPLDCIEDYARALACARQCRWRRKGLQVRRDELRKAFGRNAPGRKDAGKGLGERRRKDAADRVGDPPVELTLAPLPRGEHHTRSRNPLSSLPIGTIAWRVA